jgi:transcriptional regulator with XRE-family HTH domain
MPGRRHKDFHFVDVHVGARLRRRREQMGMSRERLAAAVGDITFQQIHKYEIAENRLSASRLHYFASFSRFPLPIADQFLRWTGRGAASSPSSDGTLQLRDRWFADLYGSFSVKWLFGLLPVLCSERKGRSSSRRLRSGLRSARKGVKGPKC